VIKTSTAVGIKYTACAQRKKPNIMKMISATHETMLSHTKSLSKTALGDRAVQSASYLAKFD